MQEGREGGSASPVLLDLIPHKGEWMARDAGGGGDGYGAEEEEELELKLGLPGGGKDCSFTTRGRRGADPSALSLAPFASKNLSSHCAGAKRGYVGTLPSQPRGHHHNQKNACLPYHLSKGELKGGAKIDQEKQMGSNGGDAADSSNTSPSRGGVAPVVGWPPIRSFRKNLTTVSVSKPTAASRSGPVEEEEDAAGCAKSKLVKINMEGVPIGRKVDLVAYSSYQKLSVAVGELFNGLLTAQRELPVGGNHEANAAEITSLLDGTGEYTLIYEDNEGDRMLVGDVPWDMFLSTVRRLRVLKSSELSSQSLRIARRRRSTEVRVVSKN